jgi:hypothetical protein
MRALTDARSPLARGSGGTANAMTLTPLRTSQGRGDDARQLLSSRYSRFTKGFETDDLKAPGRFREWG